MDFSQPALDVAESLAQRCGLLIDWICTDVYEAATAVGDRRFDVVYTGMGSLDWLPDLYRWADVVSKLLRPGGMLYVTELHPMWAALNEDGRTICQHAVNAEFTRWEGEAGSYAVPDATFQHTASWERLQTSAIYCRRC